MAVTYSAVGAFATGTTSINVPYPASVTAGQLLLIWVSNKYPPNGPATPAGWTLAAQASGGAGASGIDSGNVYVTAFYKVADGTETGSQTVSIPSANVTMTVMLSFNKSLGDWAPPLCTTGADNAGGASPMVVTGADNLLLDVGDILVGVAAVNSDAAGITSSSITATGATLTGLVTNSNNTATGDDMAFTYRKYDVTGGPSSAAPVFTVTTGATTANTPAGAALFVRLRDTASQLSSVGVG